MKFLQPRRGDPPMAGKSMLPLDRFHGILLKVNKGTQKRSSLESGGPWVTAQKPQALG